MKLKETLKLKKKSFLKFPSAEEYWISTEDDNQYSFENGVIFTTNNNNNEVWNQIINEMEKSYKTVPTSSFIVPSHSEVFFDAIPPQNHKFKLYKFFQYDEEKQKWIKNAAFIESFLKDMCINQLKPNTPLVLYLNSYENELIELNSKLIQYLYPDINEKNDEIFVYALFGKPLSLLKYNINIVEHDSSKHPIFLLLHVPENKKKMKNIQAIISQIYYFLNIICDIKILILNKEHFTDQIALLKKFNDINNSYKSSLDKNMKLRIRPSLLINIEQNDDDILSSDGDEIEEEDDDDDEIGNDIFKRMNLQIFLKNQNFIILFNSDSIHSDYERPIEIPLFYNIRTNIDQNNCFIHFININESDTYREFLTSFNKLALNYNNDIEETFDRFDFYEISYVSYFYIRIKQDSEQKMKLEEKIKKRFEQYKEFNDDCLSDSNLLLNLNNEIIKTYPSIDDDYKNDCNAIISTIRNEIIQKNKDVICCELEESSKNNLLYLTNIINSQDFWSDESKRSIKNSHVNYLKSEFFSIIKNIYEKNDRSHVFEISYSVLENQIDEDCSIIDHIFKNLGNKNSDEKKNQKIIDLDEQITKRTNYMVRERENVREMKIIIDAGQLDDVIERDY